MARPSALTPERQEAVERALQAGAPLTVAAAAGEVSTRTISRWLEEGRVVRRRLSAAPEPEREHMVPHEATAAEPDVEKVLVSVVLRAARDDWHAAIALLRWREMRRRTLR